ncbi:hypothetical protein AB5I41_09255 [Sphingomonas sp. MMS24-JH45]
MIVKEFVRKPVPKPDAKVSSTADELTKVVEAANNAMSDLSKIETAVGKLRPGADREKEAVEILGKNWKETRRIVEADWKTVNREARREGEHARQAL